MNLDVTFCVPTIPPRRSMLQRAVKSVMYQRYPAAGIAIAQDTHKRGAAATRDAALKMVTTPLVAFLDDDDELYPQHLEGLVNTMVETDADIAYPWFAVVGGDDPFPQFFGQPWDNDDPHQTTITFLCKTELARDLGGFIGPAAFDPLTGAVDDRGDRLGEDYLFILRAVEAGAKIVHWPERSWSWNHWSGNTSGRPDRW